MVTVSFETLSKSGEEYLFLDRKSTSVVGMVARGLVLGNNWCILRCYYQDL